MKVFYSPASPYAAKVCMAAHYCGLPIETVAVDAMRDPDILLTNNPLGKVPTLIEDDGTAIYDSRAIMQHLDRKGGRKLYPRNAAKRTEVECLEALCDGTLDCLLSIRMETVVRPSDFVYQPWIDRQWSKVERALDHLNADLPRTSKNLHGGHFALAGLVGYLGLRFDGQWERGRAKLKNWPNRFSRFFPDYDNMKPSA